VQGVFTLIFALLGSFRFKPALSLGHFGRYPLTQGDLAMAELPAAVFEVFPLLGLVGIVATNTGLVSRMPAMAPLIALLTVLNVAGMLSLTVGVAAFWRLLTLRRGALMAVGAGLFAAMAFAGWKGLIETLRVVLPRILPVVLHMPGAYGYKGLVTLRNGELGRGGLGISVAVVTTAGLVLLASVAHHRALLGGAWVRTTVRRDRLPARYRGPAAEVAALFFKQLSQSRAVRVNLLIPLLLTGIGAFVLRESWNALAIDKALPEGIITLHHRLAEIPFLAIALFLSVLVNAPIWMNQFGWDRSTVRALMLLPIGPRDILLGKFLGLLQLTLLGWVISGAGLLVVYRPSARELLGGVAASGIAFVVTCGAGQFISLRLPRAVPPGGMAPVPLYLSWIPTAMTAALAMAVAGIWALGGLAGRWFAPTALCVALAGAVWAWRGMLLPQAERFFLENRERLISM